MTNARYCFARIAQSAHCTNRGLMYAPARLLLVVFFFSGTFIVSPAQEQKCFEVEKTDISTPI